MSRITVNTDQVSEIATEMEALNQRLTDELEKSRALFNNMSSFWSGEAYDTARQSYNDFSNKFFGVYSEVIENYVKFLRTNVSQGYFDVETVNTSLSEEFK